MNKYQLYREYIALKYHFQPGMKYDYFRSGGKVRSMKTKVAFHNRKDQHIFDKFSSKYTDTQAKEYILANIVAGDKTWLGECFYGEGWDTYLKWKKWTDAAEYSFAQECNKFYDNQCDFQSIFMATKPGEHPIVLRLFLAGEITLETLTILDDIFGKPGALFRNFDKYLKKDFIWNDISYKAKKYKPFLERYYDRERMLKIFLHKMCEFRGKNLTNTPT